ncbi:galactose-1-phosphate uridylyltransferase [Candidatus Woesearchaeota archaeon]|nr:galactose-1-phosphate uridylyltransferase [Candidatus Woesearchaeota archaeon]
MELRRDYFLDRWVIFAPGRGKRPRQVKKASGPESSEACFFCKGNENMTPPEIGRDRPDWTIRWFPNKFPAVERKGSPEVKNSGRFFTHASAYGSHEVVVETPHHSKQLHNLSAGKLANVIGVYQERIASLQRGKSIKYVLVFKNYKAEAGTSIQHTHTQIVAYNKVPRLVEEEVKAARKFRGCPYCSIARKEARGARFIGGNRSFVWFAPYASRFQYEVMILPRKHLNSITELNREGRHMLAEAMHGILKKLGSIDTPYNFFVHNAPKGKELHFHVNICPRLSTWAGFEIGTDTIINTVLPEDAAKFYRK